MSPQENIPTQVLRRPTRREGFTMIQLLVTLLIIVVLLAISMPAYKQTRKTANQKACEENMGAIFQAEEVYRTRNRAYLGVTTAANQQTLMGTTLTCPSGSANYSVIVSGSGANQTIVVRCNNSGAHATGSTWSTSNGATFSSP